MLEEEQTAHLPGEMAAAIPAYRKIITGVNAEVCAHIKIPALCTEKCRQNRRF